MKMHLLGNNLEYLVCESTAHILGSPMKKSPFYFEWTFILAGVVAVARGRPCKKQHIHSLQRGLPEWTTRIKLTCQYTLRMHSTGNFHFFSLVYNKGILSI